MRERLVIFDFCVFSDVHKRYVVACTVGALCSLYGGCAVTDSTATELFEPDEKLPTSRLSVFHPQTH